MLQKKELPGARKINGQWAIPVTSLGVAGLRPGKPAPAEDSVVQEGDHRGVQGDHLNTLNLQHKLELAELREQSLRKELEAQKMLASERAARIEDLQKALLMLERGSSDTPAPRAVEVTYRRQHSRLRIPAIPSSAEAETAHEEEPKQPPQQGFFGRLRGLFS